jgi:hypothetical protein
MMTMCAVILEISDRQLLVRNSKTDQEVVVNTHCNCNFRVGDRVMIFYSGAMTMSIPPQISAIRIRKAPFNICF